MSQVKHDQIRQEVRNLYSQTATQQSSCCSGSSCCGSGTKSAQQISETVGYSSDQTMSVPDGANMGLGCGNPQAIANLKVGEIVLDLGSGGGFDSFLAAKQVGDSGYVIGVDMTPEMVSKARQNAETGHYSNVDFRLGEIENLPVADNSIDVIISNCVINLSPNKQRVFDEAFRVLKPLGRLAISDVVAFAELPDHIKKDMALLSGCMAGASLITELQKFLISSGFTNITLTPKNESKEFIREWAPNVPITDYVVSAYIEAVKPRLPNS